jgi:hypothetical protein
MGAPNSPGPGFTLLTDLEQYVSIGGNVTEYFKADETRTIDGSTTRQIQGDETNTTTGTKKSEVKGQVVSLNASLKSETTIGLTNSNFVGGQLSAFYGYKHDINRGWKKTVDSAHVVGEYGATKKTHVTGDYVISVDTDWKCDALSFEIECGGSRIAVTNDRISLFAKDIVITADGGDVRITASGDIKLSPGGKVKFPKGVLDDKSFKSG